jgi:tetratricopeptide (TPR) repeat protein
MGVNSGGVVVGKIGDDLRMDYTAQGQTVGLAARMQQIAEPGKVYLTGHTARLVEGFFQLGDLGPSKIQGVSEPLRVYELEGVGALRTRLDVSRSRGFSRFVGRADEMATLEAAFQRAAAGNGEVVGVVAEAGVGKSRLCYEFVERCRSKGILVREAHGISHGSSIPLLPILELLRGFFGIREGESPTEARQKTAGAILLLDETLTEQLPVLFELLGVPDPEKRVPRDEQEGLQPRISRIIRRLVRARSEREPAVILIEDLHWIDAATESFLEDLVEVAATTRTLLLVNFRPEYHADWMQKSYYLQLPLTPLGPEAVADLLRDLLGDDPSVAELGSLIQERTGGNPFFIEEVVRSLGETRSLEGSPGAYRLVEPIEEIALPSTVNAVLSARIDRLPEREKQLLQIASVVGRSFSEAVMRRVAELPDEDLSAGLRALVGAEFIHEEALYPELEFAFKHPLTREAAYGSQLTERRARLHAAVADAIEALYPERLDDQAALLAHHRESAGEPLAAARWAGRAAERVKQTHPGEALRLWLEVRSLLREAPRDPQTTALGAKACFEALVGWTEGLPEKEGSEVFEEGREAGAIEDWIDLNRDAVRLAHEAGDASVESYVEMGAAMAFNMAGQPRDALTVCDEALAKGRDDPHLVSHLTGRSPYLYLLIQRATALRLMGRHRESEGDLERAIALSREHGQLDTLAQALFERVLRAGAVGERGTAFVDAEELRQIAERTGSDFAAMQARWTLFMAQLQSGNPERAALALEEEAPQTPRVSGFMAFIGLFEMANLRLATGEPGEARTLAEQATAGLRRMGFRTFECTAQRTLAEALRRSDGATASGAIRSALARAREIVEETGARGLLPSILEEEARLAQLEGDEIAFEHHLREAHRLYTEMGATGHAERLARELAS